MKKRLLAIFLSICMAFSLLPTTSFAADAPSMEAGGSEDGIMPLTTVDDHTPPTVTGIYMNSPGGTVKVGDKLSFSVSTEDDSGINIRYSSLRFTYICDQEHEHTVTASGRQATYNEESKLATFELEITEDMLNGTYKLTQVSICDAYDNYAMFYPAGIRYPEDPGNPGNIDFDSVCFNVDGSPASEDHSSPIVSSVAMENPGAVVAVGDKLSFSVSTEDDSGINIRYSSLRFTYICDQEHEHTVTASGRQATYNEESKLATFELEITEDMLNGTYKLTQVSICDAYDNYAMFYPAGIRYPEDPGNPGNIDFDSVCFTIATPDVLPTAVSIPEAATVSVRSTRTIQPTVEPSTSIPKWTWTSADTSIAEVTITENGKSCLISGIAPGTTTITGTTQNDLTASCTVTVTDAPLPESGTVNESYQVEVGGFVDIVPTLTPADATTLYEVTSDNPHVAGIGTTAGHSGIRIEGNNAGTATITIRGANGLVMTTMVKVGRDTDRQHEKVTDPGRPATCNRPGYSDKVRCSACWYVFTESEEIPATGEHTYGEWRVVQVDTATTAGLKERYCEVCRARETETIPATGSTPENPGSPGGSSSGNTGNTGSSGSSGSSGNSTSGSTSSPSANKPGTITANSQSIPASINKGTAEVTATGKQLDTIIENAATDGIVKIDVTAAKNVTELSLSQDVVKAMNGSEDVCGLLITTQAGSIEMSGDALQTVSNALTGSNDHVAFKVDTVDVNSIPATQKYPIANVLNSAVFVELSASVIHKDGAGKTISTEPIHEFNGNVTVSVPYNRPANMERRQIIACYIADDGAITYFPVRYENGVATFTTTHFSMFAVMESRAAAFQDVDISAWYMLGVEYTLQNGLMGGYSDGRFGPNDNLSRVQLAQILYNKEGKPLANGGSSFSDVVADAWYADAISWAAANGIVGGYGGGRFGPNDNITREQLAVMIWRYSGSPAATNKELKFSDADEAGSYALDALRWAVENGIINGKGGGILDPKGLATRAQVAQMLKNYLER